MSLLSRVPLPRPQSNRDRANNGRSNQRGSRRVRVGVSTVPLRLRNRLRIISLRRHGLRLIRRISRCRNCASRRSVIRLMHVVVDAADIRFRQLERRAHSCACSCGVELRRKIGESIRARNRRAEQRCQHRDQNRANFSTCGQDESLHSVTHYTDVVQSEPLRLSVQAEFGTSNHTVARGGSLSEIEY